MDSTAVGTMLTYHLEQVQSTKVRKCSQAFLHIPKPFLLLSALCPHLSIGPGLTPLTYLFMDYLLATRWTSRGLVFHCRDFRISVYL